MKKSAIRAGLPLLIALFLLPSCTKKKAAPSPAEPASPPPRFTSPYVEFNLPGATWSCGPENEANGCHAWDCRGLDAQIHVHARAVTQVEDTMEGNFIDFAHPNPCVPTGLPAQVPEIGGTMLQGTDWKSVKIPQAATLQRFYFKRAGNKVVQVDVSTPSEKDDLLMSELKPALESIRIP